jgi:hypothetical protein
MEAAAAEAFVVQCSRDCERASLTLRPPLRQRSEVSELRPGEQGRRAVGTRRDTRAAADTRCRIEGALGVELRYWHDVAVGRAARSHGDEAAGLDDAVERAAVDDEIADDRECSGTERLDRDLCSLGEGAEGQLARGRELSTTMRMTVHDHAAGSADPFAAVAVERDGPLSGGLGARSAHRGVEERARGSAPRPRSERIFLAPALS